MAPESKTARCARINNQSGEFHGWYVYCPACEEIHVFDARWTFNGDVDRPTFRASMLVTYPKGFRCHSFVTDGRIEYLKDCTHKMAGKTVDLPALESVFNPAESEEGK